MRESIVFHDGLARLQLACEMKHFGRGYNPTCNTHPARFRLQIVSAVSIARRTTVDIRPRRQRGAQAR